MNLPRLSEKLLVPLCAPATFVFSFLEGGPVSYSCVSGGGRGWVVVFFCFNII